MTSFQHYSNAYPHPVPLPFFHPKNPQQTNLLKKQAGGKEIKIANALEQVQHQRQTKPHLFYYHLRNLKPQPLPYTNNIFLPGPQYYTTDLTLHNLSTVHLTTEDIQLLHHPANHKVAV